MSVLRNIEQRIESLFEGVFGRAFRTHVQPVELARKLVKEMDDHRAVSVSRVYVPNEYTVYLAPSDREQFAGFESSLIEELQGYLAEHARREGYVMLTPPIVLMQTDADLAVGEFGIATRMAQREGRGAAPEEPRPQPEPAPTMIYRPQPEAPEEPEPAEEPEPPREVVTLTVNGATHELSAERVVIGRSKECEIRLTDPNVSRRHAEVRPEGDAYWLIDLDSTNGVEVNGRRTKRAKLEHGDRITLGTTEIVFSQERP